MRILLGSALALSAITASPAAAQFGYSVGGTLSLLRFQSGPTAVETRGPAFSALARLSVWRIDLEAGYLEGALRPIVGPAGALDLVEGRVMLGVRPLPWIVIKAGSHARGYIRGGLTERWIQWQARGRLDGGLASKYTRAYVELWRAIDGSVNNGSGAFGAAYGGEAGLWVRLPTAPLWVRLSYSVDRLGIASGLSHDTMEKLGISVGIGAGL